MIKPERRQQMILDVAQKYADRTDKTIRYALDNGFLIWEISKPRIRLASYRLVTLPEDLMWVLTEGYLDMWKAGAAPDLQILTQYRRAQQPQLDPMTGQPQVVPIKDFKPYFRAVLIDGLPPDPVSGLQVTPPAFVWEKFQRDFIHLETEDAKKAGAI